MKPKKLLASCIALTLAVVLVLNFGTSSTPVAPPKPTTASTDSPDSRKSATRSTRQPAQPRIGAIEQPAGPSIRPDALVIEELPGTGVDLRGKTVVEALGELLAAGEAGDAASTRRAAMLLRKCQQRVSYANVPRPVPKPGPEVDRQFEARFEELAVECAEAIRGHGKIWSALMTKAAEAGDRDAQINLAFYPPERSEGPEKFAAWKTRSAEYLKALADAGDTKAAQNLAYSLATSGEDVEKLKQAIFYFERMRTTANNQTDIDFADKMIASTRREIARLESR